jgi:nucleoside 2-deoxyribosyltransferase
MHSAYLSIGYSSRSQLHTEVDAIRRVLSARNITLFVFVEQYRFTAAQSTEMMQQAFADINACDLLIAEVSEKAIGVGIEIGFALGRAKPVICLRNSAAEHSTTAAGSAGHMIVYDDVPDLSAKFADTISGYLIHDAR